MRSIGYYGHQKIKKKKTLRCSKKRILCINCVSCFFLNTIISPKKYR